MGLATVGGILLLAAVSALLPPSIASQVLDHLPFAPADASSAAGMSVALAGAIITSGSYATVLVLCLYAAAQTVLLIAKRPRVIVEAPIETLFPVAILLIPVLCLTPYVGAVSSADLLTLGVNAAAAGASAWYAFKIRRDTLWLLHVAGANPGGLTSDHKAALKGFIIGCALTAWIAYRLTH